MNFINKFKIGFIVFVCFSIFIISCSQREDSYSSAINPSITQIRSVLAKDFAPGQLEAHYLKHKDEFGYISQEDYLNGARQLLNSFADNKDILEKIRANGDILRYKVNTGEFAVMTKEGRIRTYFKANYKYWLKQ